MGRIQTKPNQINPPGTDLITTHSVQTEEGLSGSLKTCFYGVFQTHSKLL